MGDALSPVVVSHFFGEGVELAKRNERGKLLGVGSVMKALRAGDTVWGTGVMREFDKFPMAESCRFLAVRGKLSEEVLGVKVGVYGDPALLLPLIYDPVVDVVHEVGVVEHYVEKGLYKGEGFRIDVEQDWKGFVRDVKSCKRIVSSSLHGLVIGEAYGVPVEWVVLSDKVIGSGFKFRDYLTGTGRSVQDPGVFPRIKDLKGIQDKLIGAVRCLKC